MTAICILKRWCFNDLKRAYFENQKVMFWRSKGYVLKSKRSCFEGQNMTF